MARHFTCQACGAPGVQKAGPPRKWCSERCRKAQYDLVCVDCGGRVSGTDPKQRAAEPRCKTCRPRFDHESRYWTPERVVEALRERAIDGAAPDAANVQPRFLVGAAQREFGSWFAACEAAGFRPRRQGERRDHEAWRQARTYWTAERIVDAIRSHGDGPPPCREVPGGMVNAAYREFGSWRAAVVAAGLTPRIRGRRVAA